jgi:16S rRNA (cytidine1402-2'-O)-methyltransferase
MKGTLYLIPNVISDDTADWVIPMEVKLLIQNLRHFIAEDLRTARRYLRKIGYTADYDTETNFYLLNKHTPPGEIPDFILPLLNGHNVGILSESGVPCVADPGNIVVAAAQELDIHVKPLVGPSSILLSLMASGFNGQNFAFVGYLPIQEKEKKVKIKALENRILKEDQTQIFIETPYRNQKLFESLLSTCRADLKLCIARDISGPHEKILTRTIAEWRAQKFDINKVNAIFLLYK